MKLFITFLVLLLSIPLLAQEEETIEIGSFNIEWFPCKDDGKMMAEKYDINLRYPPKGNATNMDSLFKVLKQLDIELLAVEEIVDTKLFSEMAKKYLGNSYKFIYAPSPGSQKVGLLYDSAQLELIGQPQVYSNLKLKPDSWLRPGLRAYFKAKPSGFDFHAIVLHLKASPSGWNKRKQQLKILEGILEELPEKSKDADIVVLGDMNNVTKAGAGEFTPMLDRLGYYWATEELGKLPTNYWQPDYKVNRIKASTIDHIFISPDAKIEYVENSTRVGGGCAAGKPFYEGKDIPAYFKYVSDHCPVYASFKFKVDND